MALGLFAVYFKTYSYQRARAVAFGWKIDFLVQLIVRWDAALKVFEMTIQ